ncbi:MAG: Lrp/AsnC family transcriptional regulator [Euryarchaeota archaeon]|nr:Lrp/AsnC family transcriptional regulator [Euryarchaeota archaeon]
MAKSSKEQMQNDEMKIFAELQKNANESIETIAKHCGFTRQKVWRMIKQIEAKRLIWGYTTVFDEKKIGLTHFILMLKLKGKKAEERDVDTIVSRKMEEFAVKLGITMETSAYINGEYDWILTFTAENLIQAKKFCETVISAYPTYIQEMTMMQTMIFIKKHYVLNPDRKMLKDFM